jgi:hypothetical protein
LVKSLLAPLLLGLVESSAVRMKEMGLWAVVCFVVKTAVSVLGNCVAAAVLGRKA